MDMEKLQDKIYDAYYSENNTKFKRKVRTRVHWVCSNALGQEILDIGCSQGITSILLGREGKKVFGIDLSESAINDAKENLKKEDETTQHLVHFQKENLMLFDFEKKYDCVILGEVLEHINDVQSFFSKAVAQVKENGRVVVTTPFGINDFIDHKRTFYLHDLLKLQNEQLKITDIEFFGKWIGVIFEKGLNVIGEDIDYDLLYRFETAIYQNERDYINKINQYQRESKILKDKLLKAEDINTLMKKNEDFQKKFLNEKVEKVKIQKELLEQYSREQQLLKEQRELRRQYEILQHRYNNIKNSAMGKLTIKYWNWRNRRGKK